MKKHLSFLKSHFVPPQQAVEKLFEWKKYDCAIQSATGELVFSMKGVEAPSHWSQLAVEIAASKYFRKTGVPGSKSGSETSVRQMVRRVVAAITQAGKSQKYFN